MRARDKGNRGENELCQILSDHLGITVKRRLGAARDGGYDIPLPPYSIECKRQERLNIPAWWRQTVENAGDQKPLLAFRQNRDEWLVLMRLTDWIALAREELDIKASKWGDPYDTVERDDFLERPE